MILCFCSQLLVVQSNCYTSLTNRNTCYFLLPCNFSRSVTARRSCIQQGGFKISNGAALLYIARRMQNKAIYKVARFVISKISCNVPFLIVNTGDQQWRRHLTSVALRCALLGSYIITICFHHAVRLIMLRTQILHGNITGKLGTFDQVHFHTDKGKNY